MKPQMKKILISASIIGAITVLAGAIIIRSKRKKLEKAIAQGSPEIIEPAKVTTTSVLFPLKKGSGTSVAEKNAVKVIQRYINSKTLVHWWLQITPLQEDGIFGPMTEDALLKLTGVREVSYSFYKEMQSNLIQVPTLLSPDAAPYQSASGTDPFILKNGFLK